MMTYWTNLNERERLTVTIGGVCLIIYLFYLLIYSPLNSAIVNKTTQLKEKQSTLEWMNKVQKKPAESTPLQSTNSSKLLTIIAAQLSALPLQKFTYQLQQTSQGDIQLSFETIPNNLFLSWLWKLGNQYKITVKQLTVEKTARSGIVKAMVVISAK